MKVGKPKSKRVPVRLRHKIEKASAAKQRKQRKEAKKNPQWRSRLKKDPGIPNLFPYKDKVLAEIEEARRKKEEEAVRRREVAKAQRQGRAIVEKNLTVEPNADDDEEDEDLVDAEDLEDSDEMDEDEKNPMAALLASAQARAHVFPEEDDDENDDDDDDDNEEEWEGVRNSKPAPGAKATSMRKVLPKQALDDPVKAVSILLERLQRTHDGVQKLLDHYQIPPLVTAGSDTATRFLVEVARKRGRLGRGGVPNLPAAALTVLGDLNEERLQLPSAPPQTQSSSNAGKGEVQIVSQLAEPFRIEGLFGNDRGRSATERATDMDIEA